MRWLKRRSPSTAPVIVVSGLPRSGTSLMMQMLGAGGVPLLTDDERQPDANNPKGYYEFAPVKRMATGDMGWLALACGKAVKIVSPLLAYLPPDYDYRVIFVRRGLGEVVASQARMIAPRPMDTRKAESEYAAHLDKISAWLAAQTRIQTLTVNHHDAILRPHDVAQAVAAFLARPLDMGAMAAAVDPNLYRTRG